MRTPKKASESRGSSDQFVTDSDRFLTAKEALTKVANDPALPKEQAEYIELHGFANGEVSWRVRPARAEELQVGVVRPDDGDAGAT